MKTRFCLSALAVCGLFLGGPLNAGELSAPKQETVDIASCRKSEKLVLNPEEIKITNPDFTQGELGWNMTPGFKIDPNGGYGGGPGLYYERTDPKVYYICTSPHMQIKAGNKYKFSVWVRAESIQFEKKEIRCAALEIYKDGKFLGGVYPGYSPSKEWSRLEGGIVTDINCEGRITLYLGKEATGKLWFDDVRLECEDSETWVIYQLQPVMSALFSSSGTAVIKASKIGGQPENFVIYAELQSGDRPPVKVCGAPDKDGLARLDFGKDIPLGDAKISVKILDTAKKLILAEKDLPVHIERSRKEGPGVCAIDEKGRAVVDGALFMPLGLYMGRVSREDISRLAASPFNCVMPYGSNDLKFKDSQKQGLEAVREVLRAPA